jgi:excinuclease ABC subunit A
MTGVSGSGKTSLIKHILYPAVKKCIWRFHQSNRATIEALSGDLDPRVQSAVEMVDQNPIGKSSRSNPVTYIKAYDEIRSFIRGNQHLSKVRGYTVPDIFHSMSKVDDVINAKAKVKLLLKCNSSPMCI